MWFVELWKGMEQVEGKWWNGTSSRISRLGIADQYGVMIERVMKCEWLVWRELMVNRVWKKEERRGNQKEREWCLGMRGRRERHYSCGRLSCIGMHTPCQEKQWWERASLLVRMEWMEIPSKMIERGLRNARLLLPSVVSDVSLGKSIHHFISSSPLRMINSLESSFLKPNASSPKWMEVNSGKSIHHSPSGRFTLKHCTRTITECTIAKHKCFQTGHV